MDNNKKVLVIDDDEYVREACHEVLALSGYAVESARDGFEALKKIEESSYDLVIVDINMPMVDGIDFYLRIVRMSPEMKNRVLFMTGDIYGEQEALDLYIKSRRTVLKKPFTKEAFLKSVSDILDSNP